MTSSFPSDTHPNDTSSIWVYHERQEALLCGQHALNNLVQGPEFTPDALAQIAVELDALERQFLQPSNHPDDYSSHNVDASGNFSIQVLKVALQQRYGILLEHYTPSMLQRDDGHRDVTDFPAFLMHKHNHWFAIRQLNGRFFDLNSMHPFPVPISHFEIGSSLETWQQQQGYTVFVIASGLPALNRGDRPPPSSSTTVSGQWHRLSDLLQGKPTPQEQVHDTWSQLQGAGMRLDGKATTTRNNGMMELTEEEQLQMALQASLEQYTTASTTTPHHDTDNNNYSTTTTSSLVSPPPVEPPNDAPSHQIAKIQFRFPNGRRVVRRFWLSNTLADLHAYVQDECQSNTKNVELLVGYPPQQVVCTTTTTIEQAKLNGQSIQGRYL